jgi:hypothetical protein
MNKQITQDIEERSSRDNVQTPVSESMTALIAFRRIRLNDILRSAI